jgi:hypothetical protein
MEYGRAFIIRNCSCFTSPFSSSWLPKIAAQGIFRSVAATANFARTDLGSQDVPCPLSWSPEKTTRSGFSSSRTRPRSVLVRLSELTQGSRSVSRQTPLDTEKCRSATCKILNFPSREKCKGCARGTAEDQTQFTIGIKAVHAHTARRGGTSHIRSLVVPPSLELREALISQIRTKVCPLRRVRRPR